MHCHCYLLYHAGSQGSSKKSDQEDKYIYVLWSQICACSREDYLLQFHMAAVKQHDILGVQQKDTSRSPQDDYLK